MLLSAFKICVYALLIPFITLSVKMLPRRTILCGNEACTEKLFDGKFHRGMVGNHEAFLSPQVDDIVGVYGIKLSDRPDLLEGTLAREPTKKGNFYMMHIGLDSYVEFLKAAIFSNKTMYLISRDSDNRVTQKFVELKPAVPELVVDYNVYASQFAKINNLPEPKPIDYVALGYTPKVTGGGHGHSHDHDHSHDYGHSHDHSNQHLHAQTQQPSGQTAGIDVAQQQVDSIGQGVEQIPNVVDQMEKKQSSDVHEIDQNQIDTQPALSPEPLAENQPDNKVQLDIANLIESTSMPPNNLPTPTNNLPTPTPIPAQQPLVVVTIDPTNFKPLALPSSQSESNPPMPAAPANVPVSETLVAPSPAPPSDAMPPITVPIPPPSLSDPVVTIMPSSIPLVATEASLPEALPSPALPVTTAIYEKLAVQSNNPSVASLPAPALPDAPPLSQAEAADVPKLSQPPPPPPPPPPVSSTLSSLGSTAQSSISSPPLDSQQNEKVLVEIKPAEVIVEQAEAAAPQVTTKLPDQSASPELKIEVANDNVVVIDQNKHQGAFEVLETQLTTQSPTVDAQADADALAAAQANDHPEDPLQQSASDVVLSKEQAIIEEKIQNLNNEAETKKVTLDVKDDALGVCMKGDCDQVMQELKTEVDAEKMQGYLSRFGIWLGQQIGLCRNFLPEPVNHLDSAGLVIIFFVPLYVIFYFFRTFVSADSSDSEIFDCRTLHNAFTAIRERNLQIKALRSEMDASKNLSNKEQLDKVNDLEMEVGQKQLDLQQLRSNFRAVEEENDELKKKNENLKELLRKGQLERVELGDENKKLQKNNQLITEQLREMHKTMDAACEKSEQLESESRNNAAKIARIESELDLRSIENKKLDDQLQTSLTECKMLRERVQTLQNEAVQLSEIIEELRSTTSNSPNQNRKNDAISQENGTGESGWSDFEDFDADKVVRAETVEKDCLPLSKANDIMEVARLRAQMRILETDLEQAKLALQKEQNARDHLSRKVELAQLEIAKRQKEVDAKEVERIDSRNEFKKVLNMIEEKEAKVRSCEEVIDKLRSESLKWQTDVRHLEEQKKVIELKLVDLEQELKRLKSEYSRLETRNFHEIRECRQTIATLQQSLEQANAGKLYENNGMNLSGTSSSDREYGASLALNSGALSLSSVRPLWNDEHQLYLSGEPSMGRNPAHLLSNSTSPDNLSSLKRGSRSRRSKLEKGYEFGAADDYHPRQKKETRRLRSRSHGRHPLNTDYPPFSNTYADGFHYPLLGKEYSKSGSLLYSSGGSNEGRSPPPELALLSGFPPSGPMIKKPIVISRPKSTSEHVERRKS